MPHGSDGARLTARALYASGSTVGSIRPRLTARAHYASGSTVGSIRPRLTARAHYASAKLRVTDGSTGMPGPVVVDTTIFFR